jgi:predicted membrane metal-binding protein
MRAPRRIGSLDAPAAAAIGYLALDPGWVMAASLPLLLTWALGVGFRVGWEERRSENSSIRSQPSMGVQVRPGRQ